VNKSELKEENDALLPVRKEQNAEGHPRFATLRTGNYADKNTLYLKWSIRFKDGPCCWLMSWRSEDEVDDRS
jgi:hypothetical protein